MHLDLGGHPLHSRALAVWVDRLADGHWRAGGYILDLRKRGFVPVGSALQGTGIIHHMGLSAGFDPARRVLVSIEATQPTVAFEASAATCGESCRDPVARLQSLVGAHLDDELGLRLRQSFGGISGCSHLLALAQLMIPTLQWVLEDRHGVLPSHTDGTADGLRQMFRRDIIFDGHEQDDAFMRVAVQAADLWFDGRGGVGVPMERFAAYDELRLNLLLEGWPARIEALEGARRTRTRSDFVDAPWRDCEALLSPLQGIELGRGSSAVIATHFADEPPVREVLRMLTPALIQCRAALPDKWANQVATTPGHPGLIAMLDSCYMWRRGGGLERARQQITPTE